MHMFLATALMLLASGVARAQIVFTVDASADLPDAVPGNGACAAANGACTLRAALDEVRFTPPAQASFEVRVPPGDYALGHADGPLPLRLPTLAQQITLLGWNGGAPVPAGARPVITAAPGFTRQLMAARPAGGQLLRLRDLVLRGARVDASSGSADNGGALGCRSQQAGILDARRVAFEDNQAPQSVGAALFAEGCSVVLEDVAIAGNCGENGAVVSTSSTQPSARVVTLRRVSVTGNHGACDAFGDPQFHAVSLSGFLATEQWDVLLENVTVSGNQGAIRILAPLVAPSVLRQVDLRNVTLHDNDVDYLGTDSLVVSGDVELRIGHSTLGEMPGQLSDFATVASLGFTRGAFTRATGADFAPHATDLVPSASPTRLAPLGALSAYTLGHDPARGSSLIDAGAAASHASDLLLCTVTDQASRSRPSGAACDIGAIESSFLFGDGYE